MSTPPTVLHLRASNFVGGPERQLLRQLRYDLGIRQMLGVFTAAGGEGADLARAARAEGIEVAELAGGGRRDLQAARQLRRLLREENVRLLCTHGYRADLLGSWAARADGIPTVWFLRGYTGEDRKVRCYEALDRALLGWPRRIVCLSRTQADFLPARLREKARIVPNAIPTPEVNRGAARTALCARLNLPAGAVIVGAAGRLSPEKGAGFLLQAVAQLPVDVPGHFVIAGEGVLRRQLEDEARRLGIAGRVSFAGFCPDWPSLLPGCDLFVNPSLREQAPNVVLEAMAVGVAVVATRAGAVAEIAGDPPALALVDCGDAGALAAALARLLPDAGARRELAEKGAARVRAAYSPAHQQEQLAALYREFVPSPRSNPVAAEHLPTVSVVLPVRHEAQHLGALLQQLVEQDYPAHRFEVLVADGGADAADDGTARVAQNYAGRYPGRVRWIPNPGWRSSAGRNCGARASRFDWIVFVDGHCRLPGSGWLRDSMAAAVTQGATCLSRPQPLTMEAAHFWQSAIAHARAHRLGHGADSTIFDTAAAGWVNPSSSGAAYRRDLLERFGGYDESFDACEDVEFNHRLAQAGIQAWLAPEAVVHYAARRSLTGLFRQMARYGRGRVRLSRKHHDAFTLAQCLPAAWLAGLPLALAALAWAPLRWPAAIGLGLYGLALLAAAAAIGRRHGWRYGAAAPAVLATIHAGLGAGCWRELVGPALPRASAPGPMPESCSRSNL
ncbi:MAG TPA: glycosyltransferase [Terriglobales bacterium]|jgi:glycosyltransferase involved in cell wall biosynthesis/GT2 family glycosyltransferase